MPRAFVKSFLLERGMEGADLVFSLLPSMRRGPGSSDSLFARWIVYKKGWRDGLGVSHRTSVMCGSNRKTSRQLFENITSASGLNI